DRELEADVFEELDAEHQVEFLRSRSDADAATILARMAPDDVADVVTELDQERRVPILGLLPPDQERKVRTLLGYNSSTAG
ncbi:MAG: magnesium transporter MgtE, partial [Hyphomicrobiales bacterium]